MCGIVAAVGRRNVVPILMDGLQRLEYRGYDSAGIAILDERIVRVRAVGHVKDVGHKVQHAQMHGLVGIGHTRWATHGGVTEYNAHPHISKDEIAIVHNGIIENHETIRARLQQYGYVSESDTDSEVIAHLIHYYWAKDGDLLGATGRAVRELRGSYAIAAIAVRSPQIVTCARMGCPLLIGLGDSENVIASDVSALLPITHRVLYLEDGDIAELRGTEVSISDKNGSRVARKVHVSDVPLSAMELGEFRHYMQKEIHEQPRALRDTLQPVLEKGFSAELFGEQAAQVLTDVSSVQIVAAGTSYHAGLVARQWIENIASLPVAVDIASEYRHRNTAVDRCQLIVCISQSGETLDTLEALKHANARGLRKTLAICNVRESSIPRSCVLNFYTRAGIEVGVASTKAFTTQLIALFSLAVTLGRLKASVTGEQAEEHLSTCLQALRCVQQVLDLEPQICEWAAKLTGAHSALFLGRGLHYPIALEGALKLKEISYIHAEAFPAGELKHGPLALVDGNMPVVVLAPKDALLEKVVANIQEVRARGGRIFVVTESEGPLQAGDGLSILRLPVAGGTLSPLLHVIPLQLLAYHSALLRGTDVDKPRNLAKSVTVE